MTGANKITYLDGSTEILCVKCHHAQARWPMEATRGMVIEWISAKDVLPGQACDGCRVRLAREATA